MHRRKRTAAAQTDQSLKDVLHEKYHRGHADRDPTETEGLAECGTSRATKDATDLLLLLMFMRAFNSLLLGLRHLQIREMHEQVIEEALKKTFLSLTPTMFAPSLCLFVGARSCLGGFWAVLLSVLLCFFGVCGRIS